MTNGYYACVLKQRVLSSVAMVGVLLAFLYADDRLDVLDITGTFWQRLFVGRGQLPPGLLMWGGFAVLITLASREIIEIFHAKGILADRWLVKVGAVVGLTAMYVAPFASAGPAAVTLLATVVGLLFIGALFKHSWGGRCEGAIAAGGAAMFCVVYLGLLPGFFLAIRWWHGPWIVVGVIAVTKVCDVGAYFTGRAFGRHRLIPWLSPGKTWEGLVGGVVLSTAVCVALVAVGQAKGGSACGCMTTRGGGSSSISRIRGGMWRWRGLCWVWWVSWVTSRLAYLNAMRG